MEKSLGCVRLRKVERKMYSTYHRHQLNFFGLIDTLGTLALWRRIDHTKGHEHDKARE